MKTHTPSCSGILPKPLFNALWQAGGIAAVALILGFGVNAMRPDGIAWVGDWSAQARYADDAGDTMVIPLEEARGLFAAGSVLFVDARSEDEYVAGHIAGAVSLPWQRVEERFMAVVERLEGGGRIIAYCDGETCQLSHDLAKFLKEMGFADVRVLVNGWSVWRNAGLPVE
ncbi:MAG: rhodanese-like domain-containing protein [Desulfobacterales bacterium]|nr:rhodanese-like domain-containing protein [Desulfobacterales bacterium]